MALLPRIDSRVTSLPLAVINLKIVSFRTYIVIAVLDQKGYPLAFYTIALQPIAQSLARSCNISK